MDQITGNDQPVLDAAGVRAAAELLMDRSAVPGDRLAAAQDLHAGLSTLTGLRDEAGSDDQRETVLPSGTAISPVDAARCVPDFIRTGMFLRGVAQAIEAAQARFDPAPLRVLYAGCGPFAVLVLPLLHRWPAEALRLTLLDCHGRSLQAARAVAGHLGVADRIEACVEADAASYRVDPGAAPHVVITETMQRALDKEPQVPISRNLSAQLVEGGILVPERVALDLTLMNPEREFGLTPDGPPPQRQEVGRVMELTREGARCFELDWPVAEDPALRAFLRTTIDVFGDARIEGSESGLTIPVPFPTGQAPPGGHDLRPGMRLRFSYATEPVPGIAWHALPAGAGSAGQG